MNPFSKLRLPSPFKTHPPASRPSAATPPPATPASEPTATPPAATSPPTTAPTATVPSAASPSATAPTLQISRMHVASQTGYIAGRPGLARTLWAAHPNRTTRRLRKLLVAWEELGFFLSFSGAPPHLSPATENSFLKVKVAVAKSVSFLKSIRGIGDIAREAHAKEKNFIEILELYPSLYAASNVSDEDKRELFYAWHSLYLFLHKVLGADPYEVSGESVPLATDSRGQAAATRTNVRPFREGRMA